MNYLELVNATIVLVRASQAPLESSVTTMEGLTGLSFEIASYVNMALEGIENDQLRWKWMMRRGTLIVAPGETVADPRSLDGFDYLIVDGIQDSHSVRLSTQQDGSGAQRIAYVPWEAWSASQFGLSSSQGVPAHFTIDPSERIVLSSAPQQESFLSVRYRRKNQVLRASEDTPEMPNRHHMAIVWWAIARLYCLTRDVDGLRQKSEVELRRAMQKLRNEQLEDAITMEA
jgi:hypothetical protein